MKFFSATKDAQGFHYVVQLDDGSKRPFNYGLPGLYSTGKRIPDPGGTLDANGNVLQVAEMIVETEAAYRARIEGEIAAVCLTPAAVPVDLGLAGVELIAVVAGSAPIVP